MSSKIEFSCNACGQKWNDDHKDHSIQCVRCGGECCTARVSDEMDRELKRKSTELNRMVEEATDLKKKIARLRLDEIELRKLVAELTAKVKDLGGEPKRTFAA